MTLIWAIAAGIAGSIVASVIWTLADKQVRGTVPDLRTVCLYCGHPKGWRSWLPLTWLTGDAACRNCAESDGSSRRRWEVLVTAWFVLALLLTSAGELPAIFAGSAPLLMILAVDLKVQAVFLPDCYIAIVAGIFLGLIEAPSQAAGAAAGMAIAMLVCALFLVISRWIFRSLGVRTTPIGISDIYVAAAAGAIARFDGLLPALVVAVAGAAVYWVVAPLVRPAERARLAPFGPFLCIGAMVSLAL